MITLSSPPAETSVLCARALYAAAMALYDPSEHEPLTHGWSRGACPRGRRRIVDEAVDAHRDDGHWSGGLSFWTGAAGMLWALDRLGAGLGEAGLLDAHERLAGAAPGLMQGETGVLLVSRRLAPSAENDDRLASSSPATPGTRPTSCSTGRPGRCWRRSHVYEATGEERWAALWRRERGGAARASCVPIPSWAAGSGSSTAAAA